MKKLSVLLMAAGVVLLVLGCTPPEPANPEGTSSATPQVKKEAKMEVREKGVVEEIQDAAGYVVGGAQVKAYKRVESKAEKISNQHNRDVDNALNDD